MNIFLLADISCFHTTWINTPTIRCLTFSFVYVLLFSIDFFFVFSTRNCGNPSVMSALTGIRPRRLQQTKPGVPDVRLPGNISPLPPGGSRSIQARWDTYIIPPVSSGSSPSWPCPEDLHEEASSLIRCPDHLGREKWSWWMAEQCWSDWKQGCIERWNFIFLLDRNWVECENLDNVGKNNWIISAADWKREILKNPSEREKIMALIMLVVVAVMVVRTVIVMVAMEIVAVMGMMITQWLNPQTRQSEESFHVLSRKPSIFGGAVRLVCMCDSLDLSAHLDSLQRWNPIGTLAQRIMGDGRRSRSQFLFFKVEQRRRRSDLQSRYACRSWGTKKKKSN